MKKQLTAVLLVAFMGMGRLTAQEKDSVTNLPSVIVSSLSSATVVNQEIDRVFKKTFPKAQNLKWYSVNKYYLVKFIENDIKHQTLFTKKGDMKYDISYGTENLLPKVLRTKVKDAYDEYDISRVANVKEAGRSIWVVNLDNTKHLILVRMEEEDMEEVQRLVKN
jgi:PIN domain nuclease of toxin-antitoxin system